MSKTIFRTEKNADNPFVMMDRRPIENPTLTWKAKGILAYLLSRPDNWVVRLGDLIKRSPDGVSAVRAAIRELTQAGHITRREEREAGRFKQYVLIVHEQPIAPPLSGFPRAVKPHAVKPHAVNRMLNDNKVNDKELNNTGENPPMPLDWQIAAGARITKQDEFTAQLTDAANLIDTGCAGAGGLAAAFMGARHVIIPESKIKGNRKAAREMLQMGVQPDHVKQAVADLIERGMTVIDLFSVTKTACAIANPALGDIKPKQEQGVSSGHYA